jgi:hypothetical protein
MATNRMRPIHPGEVLREEFLVPLGMSAHALAMALHVPAPRVNDEDDPPQDAHRQRRLLKIVSQALHGLP